MTKEQLEKIQEIIIRNLEEKQEKDIEMINDIFRIFSENSRETVNNEGVIEAIRKENSEEDFLFEDFHADDIHPIETAPAEPASYSETESFEQILLDYKKPLAVKNFETQDPRDITLIDAVPVKEPSSNMTWDVNKKPQKKPAKQKPTLTRTKKSKPYIQENANKTPETVKPPVTEDKKPSEIITQQDTVTKPADVKSPEEIQTKPPTAEEIAEELKNEPESYEDILKELQELRAQLKSDRDS